MVKIRLMRIGAKKTPHYRVVVVDSRKKRSSNYIESLGYYDPRDTTDTPLKIDVERARHWLDNGAQPTDTALDRKSTRLNSSHVAISYAVFCLKKKKIQTTD